MKRFNHHDTEHARDLIGKEPNGLDDFEDDGYASSSDGDYGPSDPWNAPGMRVSDFI